MTKRGSGRAFLILPRQPFLEPLDRIVAVDDVGVSEQGLMQRDVRLDPADHHFLERAAHPHHAAFAAAAIDRSEEHTSEIQSLMRTSYAVLCLKKKIILTNP